MITANMAAQIRAAAARLSLRDKGHLPTDFTKLLFVAFAISPTSP
jgi:hypothetical protein